MVNVLVQAKKKGNKVSSLEARKEKEKRKETRREKHSSLKGGSVSRAMGHDVESATFDFSRGARGQFDHRRQTQVQKKNKVTTRRNPIPDYPRQRCQLVRGSAPDIAPRGEKGESRNAHRHHCPPCFLAIFFIFFIVPLKKSPVSPNVSF